MAACKHELLRIYTKEVVGQYYEPNYDEPREGEWGDTFGENEVEGLIEAICVECDQDVTDELDGKLGLPFGRC